MDFSQILVYALLIRSIVSGGCLSISDIFTMLSLRSRTIRFVDLDLLTIVRVKKHFFIWFILIRDWVDVG